MDKDGKQLNFMNDAANKILFNQLHLSQNNTKELTEDQLLMKSEKQEE
jgi:hypothetical protein